MATAGATVTATYVYTDNRYNIVMCIPTARQRLDKQIPEHAHACNNRTSIARQRISKHASLIIEAVFSAWSVQSSYKEVFSRTEKESRSEESSFGTQPAAIWAGNWIESSLRNWQQHNNGRIGNGLPKKVSKCDLKWQWDCYKSVAWIRLVKTRTLVCVCACVRTHERAQISDSWVLCIRYQ
jgi:hypothetical protein